MLQTNSPSRAVKDTLPPHDTVTESGPPGQPSAPTPGPGERIIGIRGDADMDQSLNRFALPVEELIDQGVALGSADQLATLADALREGLRRVNRALRLKEAGHAE
jgi:hypothetical protein